MLKQQSAKKNVSRFYLAVVKKQNNHKSMDIKKVERKCMRQNDFILWRADSLVVILLILEIAMKMRR